MKVLTYLFSPTGTGRRIARAIAGAIAAGSTGSADEADEADEATTCDVTHAPDAVAMAPHDAVALFVVPVYGGHAAPAALERLRTVHGEQTPAVVVAVYGNRDIDSAAAELAAFVAERGFVPVAAGAFVGEHSYSTPATPIAAGRPDTQDLDAARRFGAAVARKLATEGARAVDASRLRAPRSPRLSLVRFVAFVIRYLWQQKRHPARLLPATDTARCTRCGRCAALCPTRAIARGAEERTDPARCIACCACVKECPVGARSYASPFAPVLARNFARRKEPVTLL